MKLWLIFSCLAVLPLTGCIEREEAKKNPEKHAAAVPVRTASPTTRPVQRSVAVVGTLYGDEETLISAKVAGRINAIYADIGDRLKPAHVLAEIDPTDYELMARHKDLAYREVLAKLGLSELPSDDFNPSALPTVQKARLQADNAVAKLNRGKQFHDQKPPLISDQDFADLETAAAVARSSYDVEALAAALDDPLLAGSQVLVLAHDLAGGPLVEGRAVLGARRPGLRPARPRCDTRR